MPTRSSLVSWCAGVLVLAASAAAAAPLGGNVPGSTSPPAPPGAGTIAHDASGAGADADAEPFTQLAQKLAAGGPRVAEAAAGATPATLAGEALLPPGISAPFHTPAVRAPTSDLKPEVASSEDLPLGPGGRAATPSSAAGASGSGSWLLSTLAALGAVVGLILLLRAGLAKLSGRVQASSVSSALEVLARVSVAPRNHVLLVRLGRRILVLGDSAAGLTTLANLDDAEEVAALLQTIAAGKPHSATRGFSQLLGGFHDRFEEAQAAHEGADDQEAHVDRARHEVSGLLARLRTLSSRGGAA